MLAAVIKGPTIEAAQEEMGKALPYADLFELRLDFFDEGALSHLSEIASPLPLIFTFRKKEQRGARSISESDRLKKIEELLALGPAYCDLEADTDPAFLKKIGKKFPKIQLIGSFHDFERTPEDLKSLFKEMQNPHFSIYKIGAYAQSTIDLLRLMAFAQETPNLSCIAMGECGQPSRVLGAVVGNVIDYASLDGDQETLFQYSLKTLHDRFHYRSLNQKTEIFALIGNPVVHSPGDLFHNEVFQKKGRNAVYVKLRLDPHELAPFFQLMRVLPFRGLSVTIPLKEAILPFLDQIDLLSREIGAVNTITIHHRKSLGTNTDAPGALNAIEKHLKVKNRKVAILGAGGTARAVAYQAKKRGAHVSIFNRTLDRAQSLASELGVAAYPITAIASYSYDLLINTIPPTGQSEAMFEMPSSCTVMDVVCHPKETPILKAAKRRGCPCIYGDEMFIEQANLQQLQWDKSLYPDYIL